MSPVSSTPGPAATRILSVERVSVTYPVAGDRRRRMRALDDVSLSLFSGASLGIVGESGSGKTTLARAILGLVERSGGVISFLARRLPPTRQGAIRAYRGRMQVVFQDPGDSLNPRMQVGDIVAEPLLFSREWSGHSDAERRVEQLLGMVGLGADHVARLPRQLSGGQRQRVAIARAIATNPDVIVCDEAVSSLDVSVRAQVLNLLADLKSELGVSYLFISHDLATIRHICDDVVVMYAGRVVETGPADRLFELPQHPYTVALLEAVPIPEPNLAKVPHPLLGEPPDLSRSIDGCIFASRCPRQQEFCLRVSPELAATSENSTNVACHYPVQATESTIRAVEVRR